MAIKLYTQGLVENVTQDGNKLIFDYVGTKPDTVVEIGEGGSGGDGGGVPFAMTDVAYDKDRNEFTFTFSDNTTKKVRLDGVSDVELDTDTYNLTVTFDNGTTSTYPLGSVSDIAFNAELSALTVTFADRTTKSIPIPTGGSSGESGSGVKNVKIEEIIEDCTYLKDYINTYYKTMKALMGWKITIEYFDENIEDTVFEMERSIFNFDASRSGTVVEKAIYEGEFTDYTYAYQFIDNVYNSHLPYVYRYTTQNNPEEQVPYYWQSDNKLTVSHFALESGVMDIHQTERGLFIINALSDRSKYIPITPVTTGWEEMTGAGFHNSICRGNNLGSTMTTEQHNEIHNGTFRNMYIGDYWQTPNGKIYIAAFDYYLDETLDSSGNQYHHIVVVPEWIKDGYVSNGGASYYYNSPIYNLITDYVFELAISFNGTPVSYNEVYSPDDTISGTFVMQRNGDLLSSNQLGFFFTDSNVSEWRFAKGSSKGAFPLFTFMPRLVTAYNAHYHSLTDLKGNYWLKDTYRTSPTEELVVFGTYDNKPVSLVLARDNSGLQYGIRPFFLVE